MCDDEDDTATDRFTYKTFGAGWRNAQAPIFSDQVGVNDDNTQIIHQEHVNPVFSNLDLYFSRWFSYHTVVFI